MIEVVIRTKSGGVFSVSELVTEAVYSARRLGSAGKLEFGIIGNSPFYEKDFNFENGDIVTVSYNNVNLFMGYIFSIARSVQSEIQILAYDQLRYLKAADYSVYTGKTASFILQDIFSKYKLKYVPLTDTGVVIPIVLEKNAQLFTTIINVLNQTSMRNGVIYTLFDDYGAIKLMDVFDNKCPVILDCDSLIYDYKLTQEIDSDTYTRVMTVNRIKKNENSYVLDDSSAIERFGVLMHYESVDNLNTAQISAQQSNILKNKARVKEHITLKCLGDISVRAGKTVFVSLPDYAIDGYYVADEVVHRFNSRNHTMEVRLYN